MSSAWPGRTDTVSQYSHRFFHIHLSIAKYRFEVKNTLECHGYLGPMISLNCSFSWVESSYMLFKNKNTVYKFGFILDSL